MIELEYTANRFERLKLDLIKYPAGEIGYRLPYDEPVNHIVVTPEIRGDKAIYKTSLLEDVMAVVIKRVLKVVLKVVYEGVIDGK
jgi:hypothetical protein